MFILAISCLTTSICLDSWTWHSRFLCNIALYSIKLYLHRQSHPQLGGGFALTLSFHSFQSYISTDLQYWTPTDLRSSSFSVLSFSFHTVHGLSRQEYWSGLPFPSPLGHILSDLSTMTCLPWVALHGMGHSFIELDKAVVHVISFISFLWLLFSFCPPSNKDKRLMEASWWERLTVGARPCSVNL